MRDQLRYRDLLLIIIWEKRRITELFGDKERYSQLLEYFNKYDVDSEEPFPSQKEVLQLFGLKRAPLMDLMRSLVNEFYHSAFESYPILKTKVYISAKTITDEFFTVQVDELKNIPNKGDLISIPFLRTEFGSVMYLPVTDVYHEFENQCHTITISAKYIRKED